MNSQVGGGVIVPDADLYLSPQAAADFVGNARRRLAEIPFERELRIEQIRKSCFPSLIYCINCGQQFVTESSNFRKITRLAFCPSCQSNGINQNLPQKHCLYCGIIVDCQTDGRQIYAKSLERQTETLLGEGYQEALQVVGMYIQVVVQEKGDLGTLAGLVKKYDRRGFITGDTPIVRLHSEILQGRTAQQILDSHSFLYGSCIKPDLSDDAIESAFISFWARLHACLEHWEWECETCATFEKLKARDEILLTLKNDQQVLKNKINQFKSKC